MKGKNLKIVLVTMKYDYGDKNRGLALDIIYFKEPLLYMGHKVIFFDYMTIHKEKGKLNMNQDLLNLVKTEEPDFVLVVPFTDQFIPEVMDQIKKITKSIVYFFDDVWRIEYTKFWAPHFTYATTSDLLGIKKWRGFGLNNFIYSPFGVNHNYYVKQKKSLNEYDVSFVGGYHPTRAWVINKLKKAGINVHTFGYGWPNGRIEFNEIVNIFNKSKINLNLSNNDNYSLTYLFSNDNLLDLLKKIKRLIFSYFLNDRKTREMVKARHFEINACGGFQLSYYVEGLEKHYQIGNEIAIYNSVEDMIEKINYYLMHEEERKKIAKQGYLRTLRYHTMEKRLSDLFDTIDLNDLRNEHRNK